MIKKMKNKETLEYIKELCLFMNNNFMKIKPFPKLVISKGTNESNGILGATAYYDIKENKIVVYTEGRHIIDICKSVLHELVHHAQYLRGDLTPEIREKTIDPNYLEGDDEMLELEKEAYLNQGLIFRTWRDEKRNSV